MENKPELELESVTERSILQNAYLKFISLESLQPKRHIIGNSNGVNVRRAQNVDVIILPV